jgi:hypothetical protein
MTTNQTEAQAVAVPLKCSVGRPVPERAGLLAQIEACRREVAAWPAHMRVVAVLPRHQPEWSD